MLPIHIGSADQPLLGLYHPPATAQGREAVLICGPWGNEHVSSYRCLAQMGQQLSAKGYPVLRFDYRGTGDSWGGVDAISVEGWVEDIHTAAEELRATSGCDRLIVLGLRLGASLAFLAANKQLQASRLMLWEPIINGHDYLETLVKRHRDKMIQKNRYRTDDNQLNIEPDGHLFGFSCSDDFMKDVSKIDLLNCHKPAVSELQVIGEFENIMQPLAARLQDDDSDITVDLYPVKTGRNWDELAVLSLGFFPQPAMQEIQQLLMGSEP